MQRLISAALLSLAASLTGALHAETVSYTLDPMHTQVRFIWDHFGFSSQGALFRDVQGEIQADEDQPEKSSVAATIQVESIETGVDLLNEHLLTQPENYFDVEKHPTITFKSTGIRDADREEREFDLVGDLTVNGITREVVLDAEVRKFDTHPMWDGAKAIGIHAETTIKRSDFGMDKYVPAVGDELDVKVVLEAIETQAYKKKLKSMQEEAQQQ